MLVDCFGTLSPTTFHLGWMLVLLLLLLLLLSAAAAPAAFCDGGGGGDVSFDDIRRSSND